MQMRGCTPRSLSPPVPADDRAGVGWSDPPSSPRTSASVASDLHEALQRAGVLPPYVMAGGSVGGEYVRIYTGRYPPDVAGFVFVGFARPGMEQAGLFFTAR